MVPVAYSAPKFQHTAARRRLAASRQRNAKTGGFNTQPPEGGWDCRSHYGYRAVRFQHTAARRRLANTLSLHIIAAPSFNTQPPEGGWIDNAIAITDLVCFNTQPPEGGWQI